MLHIDGSMGEGGGQVLRTSLALSLVTGTPFHIDGIRAGRSRPGLLRQHLTCVEAAVATSGARVEGARLGATSLTFHPGRTKGGDHVFEIGTAGSTTLVLQAILPALALADGPSTLLLSGGTHNPAAPPVEFLAQSLVPLLRRMGVGIEVELLRPGFYPAGGGRLRVHVTPVRKLAPLVLHERGATTERWCTALVSHVGDGVAARERDVMLERLGWEAARGRIERRNDSVGPGNTATVTVASEQVTQLFTAFGEKTVRAETVASAVADEALAYLASDVPVWEHLADQLVVWLALAGEGSFRTCAPSRHTTTQLALLAPFLGRSLRVEAGAPGSFVVTA